MQRLLLLPPRYLHPASVVCRRKNAKRKRRLQTGST
ncbi:MULTISPECIES: cellulose biosynthesis protein BcsF [Citrobacter]